MFNFYANIKPAIGLVLCQKGITGIVETYINVIVKVCDLRVKVLVQNRDCQEVIWAAF